MEVAGFVVGEQKKKFEGVEGKKTEVGKAEEEKLDEEEGIARTVGDI